MKEDRHNQYHGNVTSFGPTENVAPVVPESTCDRQSAPRTIKKALEILGSTRSYPEFENAVRDYLANVLDSSRMDPMDQADLIDDMLIELVPALVRCEQAREFIDAKGLAKEFEEVRRQRTGQLLVASNNGRT